MDKDYILLMIGGGLTVVGTLINFLLDQVNRKQDRKKEKEVRFYDSRKEIYSRVLGALRSISSKPSDQNSVAYQDWIKDRKECDMVISQAILFAKIKLRTKLNKAGSSNYSSWVEAYGMGKGGALEDLEILMKEELGIEIEINTTNKIQKIWKLKNLMKRISSKKQIKILKE